MENKAFSAITIKAVHEERREISGMASTPASDRVNDIVEPLGLSFAKEVPLLLDHKHDQPVGTVQFGAPTAKGLPFTATIAKVAEAGEVKTRTDTAWHSVKAGLIKGVSIGFMPRESKALTNGGTRYTRAAIHELSLVAIPANPEAVITAFKSLGVTAAPAVIPTPTPAPIAAPTNLHKEVPSMSKQAPVRSALQQQIVKAVTSAWPAGAVMKDAVAPATTANSPALYYPTHAAGVLLPPVTPGLITALSQGGAANLPPNTRLLTQAALLSAVEVPQGGFVPAAAPDIEFTLTTTARKFALIVAFTGEMLAVGSFDNSVSAYVEQQLTDAANNATDAFLIGLMDAGGTAATSVAAAISAFAGDLRSAIWIGNPVTLTNLQDAANPNIGPNGGMFKNIPALPSMAAEDGKLYLLDRKRVAVHDGETFIEESTEASIVMDSAPNATMASVSLFQKNMRALKITRYADAKLLSAPQVITLS
ncbi:HK97 family phage prohead protease [Caballeronia cordobensis]|uniref:HK97 family phage prohead protease n=1 Tax=Caballeronia cordobensis TaxID=1353886 RepID=UPI00045F0F3A|nr:putative uncharacterized protein [Burkholderia sp. RPE67]